MKRYLELHKLDKKRILTLLQTHRDRISDYGVADIGVFGSYVRSEQKAKSDIDIIVEFRKDKKTFRNYINLAQYLEEIFGKQVELITTDSLSPYIGPYIKKEAEYVQIAN
ncbi:nucleotidyltransferase [Candidatus Roizmanbacteria bacterium RIFCSPHIGHO2_12_FULL_41_11]|uniref:Nucleotidyltransferase n=3 Tax=Candidatus Roizmaniibacteriota TaxID=1752723 RepID=A0A1F7JS36_9BACT|nr:MAG: nucleotidyltransferase [Candidatus Roizmanbacteria bacterium RIFCSPHIGHO2_12_FULL_41_11]OGK52804.1 MAG: nucleotidyltransferase [Candidatus Roizmanbacteria bacterium RIFCSPLOWO2_01_FULL_41_22]OGK58424.1 MAG: nucleotidyltransferase [Candidatus Roizmanbacteria bacterium RIFCSPLOWO2_02_FULL_41_9]